MIELLLMLLAISAGIIGSLYSRLVTLRNLRAAHLRDLAEICKAVADLEKQAKERNIELARLSARASAIEHYIQREFDRQMARRMKDMVTVH